MMCGWLGGGDGVGLQHNWVALLCVSRQALQRRVVATL